MIASAPLSAQKLTPTKPLASKVFPAKQVTLLHEVKALSSEELPFALEDSDVDLSEDYLDQQVYNLQVLLQLYSDKNISKIHVTIKSEAEDSIFAQYSFDFDQTQNTTAPFTYARDGKTVMLGMGKVQGYQNLQAEVILEYDGGVLSEVRSFGSW